MRQPKKVNNWKVVVLSLVAASTFWFFRALGKQYNTRITHPIEFLYSQDSLIAVEDLPNSVSMEVTGGGWDLLRQNFRVGVKPIKIPLEEPSKIRLITKGELLPLVTKHLEQFRVNYLYTDILPIRIERKKKKKVKLILDSLSVSLAENYRMVSKISVLQDSIVLTGPSSFIDTLQNEYELVLDYEEIDRPFDRTVKVNLPEGNGILAEPNTIPVEFEVDEFYRKEITSVIDTLNFPYDTTVLLDNSVAKIAYTIQSSYDKKFEGSDFKVIADYSMMNPNDSTIPTIMVFYPDRAIELNLSPDTVKLVRK